MRRSHLFYLIVAGFFLLGAGVLPVSAGLTRINPGGVVFIGENGLDISGAVGQADQIAWWPSASQIATSPPAQVVDVSNSKRAFFVEPQSFVGYTGNWYPYIPGSSQAPAAPALVVQDPAMSISIWDLDLNADMTGRSVEKGARLTFRLDTNLDAASRQSYRPDANPSADGFVNIRMKDENGVRLDPLWGTDTSSCPLTSQFVNSPSYYWGGSAGSCIWGTSAKDSGGQDRYPGGTYMVYAESVLNNMRANYQNAGADYTGKTITQSQVIQIISPNLLIETNKDSVVRGNPFSATVTGKPKGAYYIWVSGTGKMTGNPLDRPPVIALGQSNVVMDPDAGPYTIGSYVFSNGGGSTIRNDVPPSVSGLPSTRYYAQGTTSLSGVHTVGFETSPETKAGTYTLRVEGSGLSASAPIEVTKGAVTIAAPGSHTYNRGDVIHFTGTNTETSKTYLYLGNSPAGGKLTNPVAAVTNYDASTFDWTTVLSDKTWSYDWSTNGLSLPNGTYTVYAVSGPYGRTLAGDATVESVTIAINSTIAGTTQTTATTTATATVTANTTTTATTKATTAPANTTAATTSPTTRTTTAPTSPATTRPTGTPLASQSVSPVKTTHKPTEPPTSWGTGTPAEGTPLPPVIGCLAAFTGAGLAFRRRP